MQSAKPFIRDQGSGPGVLCLHSNASTSSQWRALGSLLSPRHRVIAIDSYGAGKSPEWPTDRNMKLSDEVELAEAAMALAGERFHVVGHSYGAAVAVKLALMNPTRVQSLVLYEPTLFHLVAGEKPEDSPASGIWHAATNAANSVARGNGTVAAETFIDFWMGPGSWSAMPLERQPAVAESMRNVKGWRDVTFSDNLSLEELRLLQVPVLLMWGDLSSESALSVVRILQLAFPQVTLAPQPGLGHMGPITHADRINAQIAEFVKRN
jgi:pimeloyl-ACP methyl ester carboxylesterase